MSQNYIKPPLTIKEQIFQMEKRGIIFSDKKKAEVFLLHNNYYKFSFYYKQFAENKTHIIKEENIKSFDFYLHLYLQDRKLGSLLLKYISILEDSLRTQYAYYFSTETKNAHPHLNELYFDKDYEGLNKYLIDTINGSASAYKKHYNENYNEILPPIWVMVEALPLGGLYRCIKSTNLLYLSNFYNNFHYPDKLLKSFFYSLSFVRNLCAHNSIIWNINHDKLPKLPKANNFNETIIEVKLSNTLKKLNYTNDKQIINFIIILYYLLQQLGLDDEMEKEFNSFFNSLESQYLVGYGILTKNPLVK